MANIRLKRPPTFREDGTISIYLTQGYVAIIDAADEHLAWFNWCAQVDRDGKVYASRGRREPRPGRIALHLEILGPGEGLGDHIDGDTMNCRRGNLRRVTPLENSRNRGLPKNNTSGHLGIHRNKGRWRVKLNRREVGTFSTLEAAVAARLKAERELWGIQPVRAAAHGLE